MCVRSAPALEKATVVSNTEFSPGLHSIVLRAPQAARAICAGQFVHLRISPEETLRRPLSVYRCDGDTIEIIYHVVGRGTARLAAKLAGDQTMDLIGPLGNTWPIPDGVERALIVGGGVGAAPLGMLAADLQRRGVDTTVLIAAQTKGRLIGEEHFIGCGCGVTCSTDDGSYGIAGLVTDPLREALDSGHYDVAYVCGPEVMQAKVASLTVFHGVLTYVSLERLMACGIGACLSCVVPTTRGQKRACVDGPIFNAEEVLWDEAAASRA